MSILKFRGDARLPRSCKSCASCQYFSILRPAVRCKRSACPITFVSANFRTMPRNTFFAFPFPFLLLFLVMRPERKKNTHASCWHIDLQNDIRSLQSIEPNARWFFTAHHELGHGYYFKAYSRPEVPYLLRLGAAPGFHEGVGELISLAPSQVPYLQSRGVLPADFQPDRDSISPRRRARPLDPVYLFLLRHDAALGSRHLRA